MPSYKVLKPGFYNGRLYDPEGKRPILHTNKPFPSKKKKEQVPSWLEYMETETDEQRNEREAAELEAAEKVNEKVAADQKEIKEASFLGEGKQSTKTVETL